MFLVKAWLIFLEHRIGINVNYAYLWWEIFGHIRNILKETLQDSAVFRTLLESTAHEAAKLINTDRTNTQAADHFFHQKRYNSRHRKKVLRKPKSITSRNLCYEFDN